MSKLKKLIVKLSPRQNGLLFSTPKSTTLASSIAATVERSNNNNATRLPSKTENTTKTAVNASPILVFDEKL